MGENGVASILKGYAIFNGICGIILGLIIREDYGTMAFVIAGAVIVVSFGIYAFGEVIHLLQGIYNKTGESGIEKKSVERVISTLKEIEDKVSSVSTKIEELSSEGQFRKHIEENDVCGKTIDEISDSELGETQQYDDNSTDFSKFEEKFFNCSRLKDAESVLLQYGDQLKSELFEAIKDRIDKDKYINRMYGGSEFEANKELYVKLIEETM